MQFNVSRRFADYVVSVLLHVGRGEAVPYKGIPNPE
jgi:hypothetical protein